MNKPNIPINITNISSFQSILNHPFSSMGHYFQRRIVEEFLNFQSLFSKIYTHYAMGISNQLFFSVVVSICRIHTLDGTFSLSTTAAITKKCLFLFSMAIIIREKHYFITIIKIMNLNYCNLEKLESNR